MSGSKVPRDPNLSPEMRRFLDDTSRSLDALTPATIGAAGLTQVDFLSGHIRSPANQDYRIVEKIPFGATITAFAAKTSSGTITAALKINTTAVTNGSINVTSTQGSATPSAANVMVANDALVLALSSNSSAQNLSFTIKFTRTLDS